MDSGLYAACAGLRAQSQALEVSAHNLANVNTAGFRGQQTTFQALLAVAIPTVPTDLAQLENELQTALAGAIKRQEIAMRREPDGLVISLREVGFFESGSAEMKSASQAAFDQIATMLRQRDYRLRIEGHTDDVPIHTARFSSNWELSTSRATEIVRLLIVRYGFAPNRLSAAGYAEITRLPPMAAPKDAA